MSSDNSSSGSMEDGQWSIHSQNRVDGELMEQVESVSTPLVLLEQHCTSYFHLIWLFQSLSHTLLQENLPWEIIHRMAGFLCAPRVQQMEVTVVSASSHDGSHDLEQVLNVTSGRTWWMSEINSMPLGRGQEHLEFQLGPSLRRWQGVRLSIPPLPMGPLSVREFHVGALVAENGSWKTVLARSELENRAGPQSFELSEEFDTDRARVVLHSNQISRYLPEDMEEALSVLEEDVLQQYSRVGLFSIAFY